MSSRDYLSMAIDRLVGKMSGKSQIQLGENMSLDEVNNLDQLLKFLENWTSVNGDEYVYDANGMLSLLGACLTTLFKFAIDADFEDAADIFEPKQIEILRKLLSHADNS